MYRIMLVDDEENVLNALRCKLAHLSYEVETFSQPRQALARAGEVSFDLVISDYRMPSMDGVTLVKELKKIQPNIEHDQGSGDLPLPDQALGCGQAKCSHYPGT